MKKLLSMIFILSILFSCTTKIENLKNNPGKYIGQIVTVRGEISKIINIPFSDYSFFELSDKSGNIIVFTITDHKKGEVVAFKAKVLGFDSSNQEKSTQEIISSVEDFILKSIKIDEEKVKNSAESIGKTLAKALNSLNATYMLIEQ